MKQKTNKIVSILLTLAMALSLTAAMSMTALADDTHSHDGITFEAWTYGDSLPDEPGNYYLKYDVDLRDMWTVPAGETNLCLNGHYIAADTTSNNFKVIKVGANATLGLYDCGTEEHCYRFNDDGLGVLTEESDLSFTGGYITGGKAIGSFAESLGGGVQVTSGGVFNLNGGTIFGNTAKVQGGGVHNTGTFTMNGGAVIGNTVTDYDSGNSARGAGGGVYDNGTFTMNDGTIAYNTANGTVSGGGGVHIENGCTFNMNGGEIVFNKAPNGGAGGVFVSPDETVFSVKGNVTIQNNTGKDDKDANVYLYALFYGMDTKIKVSGELDDDSNIGVSMKFIGVISDGLKGNGDITVFTSDDTTYTVLKTANGEATLLAESEQQSGQQQGSQQESGQQQGSQQESGQQQGSQQESGQQQGNQQQSQTGGNAEADQSDVSPNTGDSSNLELWIVIMMIAACGLALMLVIGKKNKVFDK